MQPETTIETKTSFLQKSWLLWLCLVVFPPVGIVILWIQEKHTKKFKISMTIVASIYFLIPIIGIITLIIVALNTTFPLYNNHADFVTAYEEKITELDLPYEMKAMEEEELVITSKLSENNLLFENIDHKGNVHELILVGQGEGTDTLLIIGALISLTNPELKEQEIGNVLKELQLFNEDIHLETNEITVEKNLVRYNFKYDPSTGVIFSVSRVN